MLFSATAAERASPLLGGNKDGSYTPEQQARWGSKTPAETASKLVTEAYNYVDKPCGSNCGAKFDAISNAIDGLTEARVLYQNDAASITLIDKQIEILRTGITSDEIVRGGAQSITNKDKAIAFALLSGPSKLVTGQNTAKALGGVEAVAGNGEGLFTNAMRTPYMPTNQTFGQAFDFSCAAASCKMAANLTDTPEAYVRSAILTDGSGTSLANIPNGLKNLGFNGSAEYSAKTTIESISAATKNGASVIVNVKTETGGIHAIVVDSVKEGMANIRDPWPLGTGSSYSVPVDSLKEVLTGKGVAIRP